MILNQTHTSEEISQSLKMLAEKYTDFVIFRVIGSSHDGRPISMIRIGLGLESLVLTAGIHGQESVNPGILTKMAEEYCRSYADHTTISNYPVRELLNRCSVIILPLLNPDGYEIVLQGFSCIRNPILRQMCKMRGIDSALWKYNARGVDLNCNFPGRSYEHQQLGEYPASEQETQALMKLFDEYETIGYLDFHSRGRIICYYRQSMPFSYNKRNHKLARSMQKISDYSLEKWEGESDTANYGGSPVNYYSQLLGKPALLVETLKNNTAFSPDPEHWERTYQEIRMMPLEIINKT